MNKKIALGMVALLGLSAALATSAADARPLTYSPGYEVGRTVTPVRDYRRDYYRGGPRYYGPRGGYYYNNGPATALGVLGGLAIGGALAAPRYYEPDCYIERREVWVPGRGYRIRPVEVCD